VSLNGIRSKVEQNEKERVKVITPPYESTIMDNKHKYCTTYQQF
jgi:hypothetical protein